MNKNIWFLKKIIFLIYFHFEKKNIKIINRRFFFRYKLDTEIIYLTLISKFVLKKTKKLIISIFLIA